jgi:cytochrome c oxidase cbb3-type subunit 3
MSQNLQRQGRILVGLVLGCTLGTSTGYGETPQPSSTKAPGVWNSAHVEAGGQRPPSATLVNPDAGKSEAAKTGAELFQAMHCDGCHGEDASGSVGPNLGDGRWIFGGSDAAVFQSIYYGRPNGMPAFGGVLGETGVWQIVTYLRTLSPPPDMPTESFEPQSSTATGRASSSH